MEILVQEKGSVHVTTVVKDSDRMAVLVHCGSVLAHAETVGCFDQNEAKSFVAEATAWLAAKQAEVQRPAQRHARHRSGEYVAVRPAVALRLAKG